MILGLTMADLYCVCKDCTKEFYIKDSDQLWFSKQGYELPKRCHACRKKRKAEKEAQLGVRDYGTKSDAKPTTADGDYQAAWCESTKS
jgi:hypothetical protein